MVSHQIIKSVNVQNKNASYERPVYMYDKKTSLNTTQQLTENSDLHTIWQYSTFQAHAYPSVASNYFTLEMK